MGSRVFLVFLIALLAGLATASYVVATPSGSFYEKGGDVFDDWGISRTRSFGSDGFYQVTEATFRPVIAFESLGENIALAYSSGVEIAAKFPDRIQRAEAIFSYVRDRVRYTSDIDQFGYDEFAQNADELATLIGQDGVGYGDCEDSAVLLAVMYKGGGYRSAIVLGDGHTATLVYLPEYEKATFLELGGESGWVWAEATGKNNPLGWVPKEFISVTLAAYEVTDEAVTGRGSPAAPATVVTKTSSGFSPFPFISVVALLWVVSLFRRRRVR